jgi:tetratricopeptide (TPR) repeat protein
MIQLQADAAMANKDWFGASQNYNRLFYRDSSDIGMQYNYAEASRLNFDIDLALRLYNKVALIDNGKKYPLTFFWIGQLLKNKGKYKDAKKWFTKFSKIKKKSTKFNFDYYIKRSQMEIEACDLAQLLINNPVGPKLEHLDTTINSKVSEYAAFEKDSTLYFSSLKNPSKKDANDVSFNKIYRSEMRKMKWQKVKELDTNINATYLHNANTCFSADYKQMIVSRCKAKNASEYTCELFLSNYVNNKWQPLERMPEPVNQKGVNTSQPSFGEVKGKPVLFFASNRAGGEGGLDIWYSFKNADGTYESPINAGKAVNTPDDEITPWYVNERHTLFFSSTYHKGLGGFDIFKSEFIKDSVFAEPQNAGYPINSSYNDIYYSVNKTRDRAYVSSNRVGSYFENKLNCCNDIYRFNIEPLNLPPTPIDTMALLTGQMKLLCPLTLYFHNDEPDPKTTRITTVKSYETTYNEYKVLVPQYMDEYPRGTQGEVKEKAANRVENFFADSVDAGMEDLRKFSNLLEKVLLKGETVKITMKGYCSPLASTDYNVNLAKRRISSLRNYFTETKSGWFVKYFNNQTPGEGKIIFEDVEIGELPASKVSDDLKDKRNSVYNPSAASERKIQIIAVSFGS